MIASRKYWETRALVFFFFSAWVRLFRQAFLISFERLRIGTRER